MTAFWKNYYVDFTIEDGQKNYVFAAPIENIETVVPLTRKIPYTVPPRAHSHVLCVMNPYGLFVTVFNLLSLFGLLFTPKTANIIVIFNFSGRRIGVPAQSAHLVSAYPYELSDDEATGTKIFMNGEVPHFTLNIHRLYESLEE